MKFHIAIGVMIVALSTTGMAQHDQSQSNKKSYANNYYQRIEKVERVFVFDPHNKRWAAYENNRKVRSGVANGGKPGYETPVGVYRILSRHDFYYRSSKYPINPDGTRGGAYMPYAMHFTRSGHAIHGSPEISNQNSSHGCIRVKTRYAKWLNEEFLTPGSKVIVYPY